MSDVPRKRIAIIGGGITGLAAAHRVLELADEKSQPVELTLFEATDRTGGVAGTRHIGDYLVETGADSFITNKPAALSLCERIGLADELISTETTYRGSLVLRKAKPVPVPDGFMLLSPAKVWPILKSPIFSPLGKLRMGMEFFVPRRKTAPGETLPDESLAAFVRRRFGKESLERIVQPLVGGIYTSDPEKLSLAATMPRFLDMEAEHRSLIIATRKQAAKQDADRERHGAGARYGLFATLRGGISDLFNKLRETIAARAEVRFGNRVDAVTRRSDGQVELRMGDAVSTFDGVVMATPAYVSSELLSAEAGQDELRNLLGQIEYASTAIVVSGHQLADIRHPLNSFGLVIPATEKRKVIAVSFSSRKFPGRAPDGRVLLRTFVGGAMQPELLDLDDRGIARIVSQELSELLGVRGQPDFMEVVRWQRAMPQYHLGHVDRVARIFELTKSLSGIELAGNAYHGVGLPDCIASADAAAERIMTTDETTPAGGNAISGK
jgi:protoporphyrinogen/coproporphyrinogen III oxidase